VPAGSLLLVHGAGSGPWVFDGWPASFPALDVVAVDLHAGLDVALASMADYARRVEEAAASLAPPVSLCGWSMGGLVVLMAAARARPHRIVLLEASAPAEVQGVHDDVVAQPGSFAPEAVYGRFPRGMRARPESALARAERKRGIPVPALRCPSLVVYGDEFPDDRGVALARLYGSSTAAFPGLDHWGLVRDESVRAAVARFLAA
jgi:pimeloyl-ACP methyl ester carboxylesterase